LRKKS
jgi:hypothetical protein